MDQRKRRPEERGRAAPHLLCAGRAERREPETRRQRPQPRRSGPVRIRPPTNAQALLQRADFYLRSGKPGEARIVLEQAAQLGSGVAALTLGAMLILVVPPSSATSRSRPIRPWHVAWYERAKDLGVAEANDRLAELAAR